jgi:hypothetical protein
MTHNIRKEINMLLDAFYVRGSPGIKYIEVPYDMLLKIKHKFIWHQIQTTAICLLVAIIAMVWYL